MAKKIIQSNSYGEAPTTLVDHPFYGLDCSDVEQVAYRDALWDKNKRIVLVDACAGSGKTTLAVAVALMYVKYGICDEAYYVRTPSSEGRIGFLPGDRSSKERSYMQPLYSSLITLGENPIALINDDNFLNQKMGTGVFTTMTDVYILGSDFSKKFVIIDEAQCMTSEQLKSILTRCHDDCKVVVIGNIELVPIIQAGATHLSVVNCETEWANQMQCCTGCSAGTRNITCVLGDFRLHQHNV